MKYFSCRIYFFFSHADETVSTVDGSALISVNNPRADAVSLAPWRCYQKDRLRDCLECQQAGIVDYSLLRGSPAHRLYRPTRPTQRLRYHVGNTLPRLRLVMQCLPNGLSGHCDRPTGVRIESTPYAQYIDVAVFGAICRVTFAHHDAALCRFLARRPFIQVLLFCHQAPIGPCQTSVLTGGNRTLALLWQDECQRTAKPDIIYGRFLFHKKYAGSLWKNKEPRGNKNRRFSVQK